MALPRWSAPCRRNANHLGVRIPCGVGRGGAVRALRTAGKGRGAGGILFAVPVRGTVWDWGGEDEDEDLRDGDRGGGVIGWVG